MMGLLSTAAFCIRSAASASAPVILLGCDSYVGSSNNGDFLIGNTFTVGTT
jgi:hypothetical protein